jgi:hypothetical protein
MSRVRDTYVSQDFTTLVTLVTFSLYATQRV